MSPSKSSFNYKSATPRICNDCNTDQAIQWRKTHPGYRGSGIITSIPKEDRLLASAISARLSDAKARAVKRNQPFDLDRMYLYTLFKEQSRVCALSGVKLNLVKKDMCCLSLDKIIPDLGYVKGNVQWLAWAVNRAKGDMSTEMFTDMCRVILEYQKVQRLSKSSES